MSFFSASLRLCAIYSFLQFSSVLSQSHRDSEKEEVDLWVSVSFSKGGASLVPAAPGFGKGGTQRDPPLGKGDVGKETTHVTVCADEGTKRLSPLVLLCALCGSKTAQ